MARDNEPKYRFMPVWKVTMREDQLHTYVVITTGQTAIWSVSRSYLYHATVDGLRALCNRAILVRHEESGCWDRDRSNSTMTCYKCAERVKRVKSAKPVDVDAALRRHAAQDFGVPERDLGRKFS